MNNRKKSIVNIVCSGLSQVITIAFGLILPRLFVVSYGSEVNGLLSSLSNFLICLNLFEAGVGTATLQALYRPVAESDWDSINGVLSATKHFYRKTGRWYLISLLVLSLVYPMIVSSELPYHTVCGAVFLSGIGNVISFYFQGRYNLLLRAEGKNYILTNLNMVVNVLVNLSKVVLIWLGADIVLILLAAFLIQCIYMVFILWYVKRNYRELNEQVTPNVEAIGQKNFVLVHQIGELVFKNTDVMILTVFCGLKVVSVYSMFKMISANLDTLLSIFMEGINFLLGQTYQTDRERYKRMIDLTESMYSAISYAVYAVALFMYLPFMRLYTAGVTDINYVDGKLAVLFVATALLSHSRVPMVNTINYAGHFKQTLRPSIIETVINLVTSLIGVYFWGIYGVLLGTVVALLYRTNDIIIYANTKCLDRKPWRTYQIYLVNLVMLFVSNGVFRLLFGNVEMKSFFVFLLVAAASAVLSLVMFVLAQLLVFPHCREGLKKILSRT